MALVAHCGLGKFHNAGTINKIEPDFLAIEYAFIMFVLVFMVKAKRLQPIQRVPRFLNFGGTQNAGNQREAVLMQSFCLPFRIIKRIGRQRISKIFKRWHRVPFRKTGIGYRVSVNTFVC